jgi:hypothetical protein
MATIQPAQQKTQSSSSAPTVRITSNQSTVQSAVNPLVPKPSVAGATPISTSVPTNALPQQQPAPPALNPASQPGPIGSSRPSAAPVQNATSLSNVSSLPSPAAQPQKTSAQVNIQSQPNVTFATAATGPPSSKRRHCWQLLLAVLARWREPVKDNWTTKDSRLNSPMH